MTRRPPRSAAWRSVVPMAVAAVLLLSGAAMAITWSPPAEPEGPTRLAPVWAVPMRVDTSFLGGYAAGSFQQALQTIASDLTPEERAMVGRYLDRIFVGVLEANGLGRTGRLRVAYERVLRPDGTARSVRILAAEAAVGGQLHTAFYFDNDGNPTYFDGSGRSLDQRAWAGPLRGPLHVTSPFGLRRMHPLLNRVLPHHGTDYAAPVGTPVYATADGVIGFAGERGGYGYLVEVQHPSGYTTRFAHLSRIAVRQGTPVAQGDLIAYSGMTGLATGPHLHYEVRRHGRPLDPERVLAFEGFAAEIGFDAVWSRERRALGRLLARAPTVLQTRGPAE
jgi:murein DD-endopeptidase MepM/ murein hydrolase activator NlpD